MGVQRTEMSPRTVSWSLCASSIHLWRQWWSLQTPGMKKWRVFFFHRIWGFHGISSFQTWDLRFKTRNGFKELISWNITKYQRVCGKIGGTFDRKSVETLFKSLCCQGNHPLFKQSVKFMEHLFRCNLSERGDVTKCWGFFSLKI